MIIDTCWARNDDENNTKIALQTTNIRRGERSYMSNTTIDITDNLIHKNAGLR